MIASKSLRDNAKSDIFGIQKDVVIVYNLIRVGEVIKLLRESAVWLCRSIANYNMSTKLNTMLLGYIILYNALF